MHALTQRGLGMRGVCVKVSVDKDEGRIGEKARAKGHKYLEKNILKYLSASGAWGMYTVLPTVREQTEVCCIARIINQ